MCGIAGLISRAPVEETEPRVARAVEELRHRGPDGEGVFVQAPASGAALIRVSGTRRQLPSVGASGDAKGVALGHRRLAIIDLTDAGAQPMATADGRYVIVFNGEIYNHVELRAELQGAGMSFRSTSDTEVLLAGFQRWGLRLFDRIVGMFAFALLDRAEASLLLARDCFGMKPMYYASGARGFGFASEPRALLSLMDIRPTADPQGLADYLDNGLTDHREGTLFDAIRTVPPASYLRVSLKDGAPAECVRYWRPPIDRVDDRPPETIARELRELFLRSVELHLRSDVRVGTLLSGGIDSSAIVMAMREVGGARLEIRTFSFIPDAGAISEERWIDDVNRAAGAVAHKVRIPRNAWESESAHVAEHQGEPFGSLAIHAQSALFRTASEQHVPVLLDGQGADEMLAGYTLFRGARLAGHLRRFEAAAALRFAAGLGSLRAPWRQKLKPYVDAVEQLAPAAIASASGSFGRAPGLAAPAWMRARGVRPRQAWRPAGQMPLHERLRESLEVTSLPALLRYSDRSAMMYGVESRLPFLTRDLAELALALPDRLLVSDDGIGKAIFRDAMRGLVPDSVLDRREKLGFPVPLGEWMLESRHAMGLVRTGSALPCVNGPAVRAWASGIEAGHLPAASKLFLLWRLVGLAEWVRAYDVALP